MSSDGTTLDPASEKVIDNYQSSEGNKIYKINGTYYVFHNQNVPHGPRVGVMMRSTNLFGPYEKKFAANVTAKQRPSVMESRMGLF